MEEFTLDLSDPLFLEFYGILLGDGWIGEYKYKNKTNYLIGISCNAYSDKPFLSYIQKNIKTLFNRNVQLKKCSKPTVMEIRFHYKTFHKQLNQKLGFPIGKKINLKLCKQIYSLEFDKLRYVIRGIFDTDGSLYFDKTPVGRPYPCISIEMKAPILIKQVYDFLIKRGFKVYYRIRKTRDSSMITLKGSKQLDKWMKEIGSGNPKHFLKYYNGLGRI